MSYLTFTYLTAEPLSNQSSGAPTPNIHTYLGSRHKGNLESRAVGKKWGPLLLSAIGRKLNTSQAQIPAWAAV